MCLSHSMMHWALGYRRIKDASFFCPTPVLCILRDLQPAVNTHSLLARQPRSFYRKRSTATENYLITVDKSGNTGGSGKEDKGEDKSAFKYK